MTNPFTQGPSPTGLTPVAAWARFVSRALLKRLDPDRFAALVPIHFSEHPPLGPVVIADILLRPTPEACETLDSRAIHYAMALLDLRLIDIPAILRALYKYSSAHTRARPHESDQLEGNGEKETAAGVDGKKKNKGKDEQGKQQLQKKILRWRNSYPAEVAVLVRLAPVLAKGTVPLNPRHVVQMLKVLVSWMALLVEAAAAISREAFGALGMVKDETERARGALARFMVVVAENQTVLATLAKPECKGACKGLNDALQSFLPLEMQRAPEITARLERLRTQTLVKNLPPSKRDTVEQNNYMDNLVSLDSVQLPEVPVVNSRAGLYIYMSAALVGRPMLDDNALFAYLRNRYQDDVQTAAVQLILASFDLLANAVFRNEGPRTGHLLKSFVVNKVPLILVSLAGMSSMYPFNAELCISEALGQVDPNVFPTLSGMFDMSTNSSFHDSVRQDFCFACQLHGLLSETAVETLLGDITWQSLPEEGRYKKDDLVAACLQDSHRAQKLIGELENMNGNVGAVAQALVEIIASLCRNKETMALKPLCSQLAAKPLSIDVLLLFERPHRILQPLWELLDGWTSYEEDQGEYQPVFEEFGSILLLLLAIVYRYNLSAADLGIQSRNSFVGRLLNGGDLWKPLEELTEQENSRLSGWILGLFDTEAGGLGDDLMASCPPQDFYLLMPTLFHQIVLAMYTGHLTDEVLKGGLEYLVGVLLLPSMVPALLHISNRLYVASPLQPVIIKVLQHIILPTSSISEEASTMLSAVLNIVAKPLDSALRYYQRQDPQCQEIEPLLRAIRENVLLSRRTGAADHNELEAWGSMQITSGGATHVGMSAAVRHTIQSLVQWAQGPPLNGMPAAYTHRQTLAATQLLGGPSHLAALLDELKTFHNSPHAGVAYDVVTAMLCAPDVRSGEDLSAATTTPSSSGNDASSGPNHSRRAPTATSSSSLRRFLKWEAEEFPRLRRSDPVLAETVLRLHRRVEAQLASPAPTADVDAAAVAAAAAMLQPELAGALGGDVPGLGDALAAAVAQRAGGEHGDGMVLDHSGGDLGGLGGEMGSAGGGGQGGAGGGVGDLGGTGDGGIFGGLGGAGEFSTDFGSWEMDLEG